MIQRFYIDTSVIGGVFDSEFEEHSTILMEKVKLGQIKLGFPILEIHSPKDIVE